ncbi:MAG TPA: amidohydrolase family protein [Planctomycetota bacterium]
MHINLYILYLVICVGQDPAPGPVAIKNVRILTVAGAEIASGTIVLKDGKIEALGADVAAPAGARVIDGAGRVVMPGLVHPYTRIGGSRGGTGNAPNHLALEELIPSLDGYRPVIRAGFTTLALYPAGGPLSGQAVAFKPRGVARDQMSFLSPAYLRIDVDANTQSKEQLRLALDGAKRWKDRRGGGEAKPDDRTAPLVQFLKGELRALVDIQSPGEYLHFRQVLKPFEDSALKFAIVGSSDLWRAAEALGARKETVLLRPDPWRPDPRDPVVPDTRIRVNPASELAAAGCTVGLMPSDDFAGLEAHLFRAAQIVKAGLSRDLALRAITIVPAEAAGVGKRVGSLEKGKDADLLLLDGDPFCGTARILMVFIDGRVELEVTP